MVLDRVKKNKKTIDTDKVLVSFERWQGVSIRIQKQQRVEETKTIDTDKNPRFVWGPPDASSSWRDGILILQNCNWRRRKVESLDDRIIVTLFFLLIEMIY
jgi:hypothetical protein